MADADLDVVIRQLARQLSFLTSMIKGARICNHSTVLAITREAITTFVGMAMNAR